ncbi:MAG: SpoIIIAH-like family protein [Syntrophomonadaceae bacterium]|nr:SpoIIIAH-like family protein [Syntrophomonadaceae bacterium]
MVIQMKDWRRWALVGCAVMLSILALTLGGGQEGETGAPSFSAITVMDDMAQQPNDQGIANDATEAGAAAAAVPVSAVAITDETVLTDFGFADDDPGRIKAQQAAGGSELLAGYRLRRERLRGEQTAMLQAVIASELSSEQSRENAEAQLMALSRQAEKELLAETLIKSQGAEDCAVMLTGDGAAVIADSALDSVAVAALVAQTTGIAMEKISVLRLPSAP